MKKRYWLLGLLLSTILLRGTIYRLVVKYEVVQQRALSILPAGGEQQEIAAWVAAHPTATVRAISRFAARETANRLSFVARNAPSDPATALSKGQTHCVGYARLFSAIVSQVIAELPPERSLEQKHAVGQLHLLGYNLHQLSSRPFWQDHDFNCITDVATGETVCVDPTLYDYARIRSISH